MRIGRKGWGEGLFDFDEHFHTKKTSADLVCWEGQGLSESWTWRTKNRATRWRISALAIAACTGSIVKAQVPATVNDFFQRGTQPDQSGGANFVPILPSYNCAFCHETANPNPIPIYPRWRGSMMANSARDPLFHACLAVANQDVSFAGELCIRCHAPRAWLGGRSDPPDGSALTSDDLDSIMCNFCHRMVDPVFQSGISPAQDQPILNALQSAGLLPGNPGNGNFVIDPSDVRRGPFNDVPQNLHGVPIIYSPFHSKSQMCATCHDVSNPVLTRQPNGTYVLDTLNAAHPTQNQYDMFPVERTYSEWLNSTYATVGVDADGVFGGNHPTGIMRTCQDCHMPDTQTNGCYSQNPPFFQRPNVPAHDFNGGNTWMQGILYNLYPDDTNLDYLNESVVRATYMLQNASTMELAQDDCDLRVRLTNETGHKLPTGYPEGRRMWINVVFRDAATVPIVEHGDYDNVTADLSEPDTKVYEAQLGLDETLAKTAGLPEGPSFHFALNNKWFKDNRIPPRGFTNAAFEAAQCAPVAATYADGQYWDDTHFRVPPGAASAVVSVYYQTASKEYITFLRDENVTNNAGDIMYEQWELTGKSPPVQMEQMTLGGLNPSLFGDADCDLDLDQTDYSWMDECLTGKGVTLALGCEMFDGDLDHDVDMDDFLLFQAGFTGAL